jgi:NTP pyrophosphatase (non-canonical NTP hydrolase)
MATLQITEEEKQLSQKAYEQFDTYAGVTADADISGMFCLQQLQIEHHRWQAKALPDNADASLTVMTLGIVEEAAWELVEAVERGDRDEQYDTIGDILVYTVAACTNLRLDFATLARYFDPKTLQQPDSGEGLLELFKAVGKLCHVVGKERQKTRGYDEVAKVREHAGAAISRICGAVHWLAFANDWEVALLFEDVLTRVMKRDWKANKINGDVSAQTALPLAEQ